MVKRNSLFSTAMEEVENELDAAILAEQADYIAPNELIAEEEVAIAEQMDAVQESTELIEHNTQQLEDCNQVVQALEAIREVAKKGLKNGGLSVDAINVYNIATEAFAKRAGIKAIPAIALESVGEGPNKLKTTKIAVESISEHLKTIYDAIVKMIKKSIQWIKNFFLTIFDTHLRLEKQIGALYIKAKGLSGEPKVKEFSHAGLANDLSVNGKFNENKILSVLEFLSSKGFNAIKASEEAVSKIIEDVKQPNFLSKIISPDSDMDGSPIPNSELKFYKKAIDGETIVRVDEMPGNKTFIKYGIAKPTPARDMAEKGLHHMTGYIGPFDPERKRPEGQAAMMQVIPVDGLVVMLDFLKKEIEKIKHTKNTLIPTLMKTKERALVVAEAEMKFDEASEKDAVLKIKFIQKQVSGMDQVCFSMLTYQTHLIKNLVQYVNESIKHY